MQTFYLLPYLIVVSSLNCSDSISLSMAQFSVALKLNPVIKVWPKSLVLWTRFLHFSPRLWEHFGRSVVLTCIISTICIFFGPELKTTDLCQFYFTLWKLIAWAVVFWSLPCLQAVPHLTLCCHIVPSKRETKTPPRWKSHCDPSALKSLYWHGLWMGWCVQRI